MKRALYLLLALALLAAAAYGAWWAWRTYPEQIEQALTRLDNPFSSSNEPDELRVSGMFEAHSVTVTTEMGGRIVELLAVEGDQVQAGQMVARIDGALLEAQIAQAEAAVTVAQAQLQLAQAQARPEEWRVARAAVSLAEAGLEGARQARRDAQILRDNPQELDAQIIAARAEVDVAEHQLAAARATAQAADLELEFWGRTVELLRGGADIEVPVPGGTTIVHLDTAGDKVDAAHLQWNLTSQRTWQAYEAAREAEAALASAQTALAHLLAQRDDPQELQAQVDAAAAQVEVAEATLQTAQVGLLALEEGAGQEQIALAEAALEQAQAALDALEVQREKLILRAPQAGLVSVCPVQPGELALPGSPLLQISDLSEMTLTLYVPEERLGEVHLGQTVQIVVDSFPNRSFQGEVARIADEAEFTPRYVAAQEDGVTLVFAVKVRLSNPDLMLKPGMPADATFGES